MEYRNNFSPGLRQYKWKASKAGKHSKVEKDKIIKKEVPKNIENQITNNDEVNTSQNVYNQQPLDNNEKNLIIENILGEMESEKKGIN